MLRIARRRRREILGGGGGGGEWVIVGRLHEVVTSYFVCLMCVSSNSVIDLLRRIARKVLNCKSTSFISYILGYSQVHLEYTNYHGIKVKA